MLLHRAYVVFSECEGNENLLLYFLSGPISLLRELMISDGAIEVRSRIYKLVLPVKSIDY
jgi:hypothetical protein